MTAGLAPPLGDRPVHGALAPRVTGSSAVVEWLLTWPGIGIALDCSALVMARVAWPLAASCAVGAAAGISTDAAGGTDGSATDGTTSCELALGSGGSALRLSQAASPSRASARAASAMGLEWGLACRAVAQPRLSAAKPQFSSLSITALTWSARLSW